jgi:hypothetical protein
MSNLPFVLQTAQLPAVTDAVPGRDVPTSEDPLPAAITIDTTGYVLERTKRKTEVKGETLDGN